MRLNPYQTNLVLKLKLDPFDPKFQTGEPVEYILGKAEFRGHIFNVNRNVLIPRVETEKTVDIALGNLPLNTKLVRFADVATGSGVIGISFALELIERNIQFDGYLSDISEEALKVAKSNVDLVLDPEHQNCFTNKINESKIKVVKSNLLKFYPKGKVFDVIFANLPYIPTSRIKELDSSVKDYEPVLALDGGEDGLDLIKRMIVESRDWLHRNGVLILEVDDTHTKSVADSLGMNAKIEVKNDQFGKNRFWIVRY